MKFSSNLIRIFLLAVMSALMSLQSAANAAQLQLSWVDNSTDETGFHVERKTGTTGTYAQIASVGANVTSYTDSTLMDLTTYCYRVNAFNSYGTSPYSPEACASTPTPVQMFSLVVTRAGTGTGTVSSSPSGVNCGNTCSASYQSGTAVTLSATPASGSTFAGWSGTGCTNGSVTMNANISCTAIFNLQAASIYTLSITKTGTGNGTVTSIPTGINCGSTCSATYNSGTTVALTAMPAGGSTFAGWSGPGCGSGMVLMTANITCTATFNIAPQKYTLTVTVATTVTSYGTGTGTVTSSPAGITACNSICSASYDAGTIVTLTPTPEPNSTFAGWSGTGCTSGVVTLTSNISCLATFNPIAPQTYTLSVVKSGTGNGSVTSSPAGINCGSTCSATYKSGTAVALNATPGSGSTFAGWSGTGCGGNVTINANTICTAIFQSSVNQLQSRIGLFRPSTGEWFLDDNGNGHWDAGDIYIKTFGHSGDLPVIGNWSENEVSNIGTFTPATGMWQLDTNGDGVLDCTVDACVGPFGQAGDFPVTRQMSGTTASTIGTYTPESIVKINGRNKIKRGHWKFDNNDNSIFDGCTIDQCDTFSAVGEIPVVGDWNGTGNDDIALFISKNGTWYLDRNGNEKWDGCTKDKCLGQFGAKGDLPIAGDWDGTGKIRIGVFRPSTAMWYLDLNANGKLDDCGVDVCIGPFGQPGDLPVVGRW
jgi:List-Bact-rpt repeat protein